MEMHCLSLRVHASVDCDPIILTNTIDAEHMKETLQLLAAHAGNEILKDSFLIDSWDIHDDPRLIPIIERRNAAQWLELYEHGAPF